MGMVYPRFFRRLTTMANQNHLMHPRAANNYADNGYFPTDSATLFGIVKRLDIAGNHIRIFDPCCGAGDALTSIHEHLSSCGSVCRSYGIELSRERAEQAAGRLDYVIRGDIESCILQSKQVGLLFLNPPYGYAAADQLSNSRTKRLEEIFFSLTVPALQENGILVLIVPATALTDTFTQEIALRFAEVRMFRAGVDTYKQVVIFGIKPKLRTAIGKTLAKRQQSVLLQYDAAPAIDTGADFIYEVPQAPAGQFRPLNHTVDAEGLTAELMPLHGESLWPHFRQWFGAELVQEKRRPLCALGSWHAALALAAGQVNGIVTASDGRRLLIKGSTFKTKVDSVEEQEKGDGSTVVVTTRLDRFVPSIRAFDLTVGRPSFGDVLTIK